MADTTTTSGTAAQPANRRAGCRRVGLLALGAVLMLVHRFRDSPAPVGPE